MTAMSDAERRDFDERCLATLFVEGEDGLRKRLCGGLVRHLAEELNLPLATIQRYCGHDHVNETVDHPVADLERDASVPR